MGLENGTNIGSLQCGCYFDCNDYRCDKIRMKANECARGYLQTGCQACSGNVIHFQKMEVPSYPELDFKSIVVQERCTLSTYSQPDFDEEDGIEVVVGTGIHDNWSSPILSYNCSCDSTRPPKDLDYLEKENLDRPIMIKIPSSMENISRSLDQYPDHQGLVSALKSIKNNRAPHRAYIILLGMTGSGKSTTINFLFDNITIAAVGNSTSTTKAIHEYSIPISVDELGIVNAELRVIDTPGLGDTRGLYNDAKFLATFEHFLNSHEDLNTRIPNIVMIATQFNDNRAKGNSSQFVKTLRVIDLLGDRLFDKSYSNIITVLTHYMNDVRSLQRNPLPKIKMFREIIEEYTRFPRPVSIVVAENKPIEQEIPFVNGFYKLPNGEYYPKNIFDKMQQVMVNGGDPIGEAIIRNVFKNPQQVSIMEKVIPIFDNTTNARVNHYLRVLLDGLIMPEKTAISEVLAKAFPKLPLDLQQNYPETLPYLQKALNVRNIITLQTIPKTTVGVVQLFKELRVTSAVIELLKIAFDLKVPELDTALLTGQSYDIMNDRVLPLSRIRFSTSGVSEIGFLIPDMMSCKIGKKISSFFYLFDTKTEYIKTRLSFLNVEGDLNYEDLNRNLRTGYNALDLQRLEVIENKTQIQLSTVTENRMFHLILNDRYKLKPDFISRVSSLSKFNASDYVGVAGWKAFFFDCGTHVVHSAQGGGAIEISLKNINPNDTFTQAKDHIASLVGNLVGLIDDVSNGKHPSSRITTFHPKYRLNFRGGDFKYHTADFEHLPMEEYIGLLNGWEKSLAFQPIMLESTIKLIPLHEVVKRGLKNATITDNIKHATAALFNASLTYVPPYVPPDLSDTLFDIHSRK